MTPYNLEIWTPNFVLRSYGQIASIKHNTDYLDYEKNKIDVTRMEVAEGDYIRINNGTECYTGVVSTVENKKKKRSIMYQDFSTLLDVDMVVDVELLKSNTLENFIAHYLNQTYIVNEDSLQRITGFEVEILCATNHTHLELEEPFCNFYDDVILPAFKSYQIKIDWQIDIPKKRIAAVINKSTSKIQTIETRLPNIISNSFTLRKASNTTNKVIVYNEENLQEKKEYYLTNAGEISAINVDRITPVNFCIEKVKHKAAEETFHDVSLEKAKAIFSKIKYENLIEIECFLNDSLIKPLEMDIGQQVNILHEGNSYLSVLTGKKINNTITLIFGTVRMELTKILKGRG